MVGGEQAQRVGVYILAGAGRGWTHARVCLRTRSWALLFGLVGEVSLGTISSALGGKRGCTTGYFWRAPLLSLSGNLRPV